MLTSLFIICSYFHIHKQKVIKGESAELLIGRGGEPLASVHLTALDTIPQAFILKKLTF